MYSSVPEYHLFDLKVIFVAVKLSMHVNSVDVLQARGPSTQIHT